MSYTKGVDTEARKETNMRIENLDFRTFEKRARKMTEKSLRYVINDCKAAIKSMPEGVKAGYYADEIHVCVGEINRRNKKTQR